MCIVKHYTNKFDVTTFCVDGVAIEMPIPDPGRTDKTLYCEKGKVRVIETATVVYIYSYGKN